MLLVGPDASQLRAFSGALERAGVATRWADDVAIASGMVGDFRPSVVVLVTDLRRPAAHEMLATLSVFAGTAELPLVVLSREASLRAEIDALTAGAIDVVRLPTELPIFVDRIHGHLSNRPDPARSRAAKDMRGPALLKRVGNHVRGRRETATLTIIGPPDGGTLAFTAGQIQKARFGALEGSAAIERLLTTPTMQRWAIRLEGDAGTRATTPAPADDATFSIDVDVDIDDSDHEIVDDDLVVDAVEDVLAPPPAQKAPSIDLEIVVDDEEPVRGSPSKSATATDASEDVDVLLEDAALFEVSEVVTAPALEALTPSTSTGLPPPLVLVVDDDEALVKIYSSFLARNGARVETASDGQAGYERAVKVRPDAIVSDIMMPNVDGWGFLTLVRHDMRIRDTKFLLLSCHGEYLERLKTLDAGADAYLEKGLRGDEVARHVDNALSFRRQLAATLKPGLTFSGQLATYGVRPLLRALAQAGLSGVLTLEDRFGRYLVQLEMGRLMATLAAVGDTERSGDEAFTVILNLDDAAFDFESDVLMLVDEEPRQMDDVIDVVGAALNRRRALAEERMFASDAKLIANDQLATFYSLVCPKAARPVADALCHGVAPRDVMATSDASPLLIESVVRDLLRKGVAHFGP